MASAARSRRPRRDAQRSAQQAIRPAPISNRPVAEPHDASAKGIHPAAIGAALVVAVWFVISMAISFSGTGETDYLIVVVFAFSLIFFTLTVGIASHSARVRRSGELPDFRRFLSGEVSIFTGEVSGREALVQLLTLPIVVAIGAMAIGLVFDLQL